MIKLTDILSEILSEKKLCPKGEAYRQRRLAAGEVSSAYLSGRARKVCKGLMEEDDLDLSESLDDWFEEDWVRIDTQGNITGPCGTMKKGKATTRCLPRAKANSLTKDERAATSKKKAASSKQFVPNTKKAKVKLKEGLEDTSWTNDKDQTITLQQLLDAIKDYPVVQAPIEKIEKIIIRKDTGGIESDRLSAADVKYPIIIVTDDSGNYKYILDGNHRANKAIDAELESIPAKLVNISKLPQEFQDVLSENAKEQENVEEDEAVDVECEKCGWEWNTADSDPNDKYICHKCGFDNSYRYANKANNDDEIEEYDVENKDDIREFVEFMESYQQELNEADCDCILEAKYQGRTVPLGKPMRGDSKKFKVYVKNPKTGKVVKVNFGAKGMNIKKNNPVRRKAFRARHNCANPGPRTKARYWSCRKW